VGIVVGVEVAVNVGVDVDINVGVDVSVGISVDMATGCGEGTCVETGWLQATRTRLMIVASNR